MPLQRTKDAPKFDGKVPALLPQFLKDVDLLVTAAGINDAKKIYYAMRYVDLDEAEVWQTVSATSIVILDWDDFVDQVKELYLGCEGSNCFCRADLHYLVQDSWMASMHSHKDLGEYRCKFTKILSHLVDTRKLSETEWNNLFL